MHFDRSVAPSIDAPLPHPAGRIQSGGEGGVRQQHPTRRQVPVETGIQARRNDVVIHHVGNGRRRGRLASQGRCRLVSARRKFIPARPENRHGVMDRIAGSGMVQRGAMFMFRRFAPNPMAGRVGATAGRTGPAMA